MKTQPAQICRIALELLRSGKVQVVLCYNSLARWLPLFLNRISDLKLAGFSIGDAMSSMIEGDLSVGIYSISMRAFPKPRILYVGQSKYLNNRIKQHKSLLANGKHHNPHLQSVFNKYGFTGMVFEVVCNCRIGELDDLEQFYINELNPECNIARDIKDWRNRFSNIYDEPTLLDLEFPGLELDWKPQEWHKWVYGGSTNPCY